MDVLQNMRVKYMRMWIECIFVLNEIFPQIEYSKDGYTPMNPVSR